MAEMMEARMDWVPVVTTQNARGQWVPTIPLPCFFWLGVPFTECRCGAKFLGSHRGRALRRYEEHFALAHILEPGITHA